MISAPALTVALTLLSMALGMLALARSFGWKVPTRRPAARNMASPDARGGSKRG